MLLEKDFSGEYCVFCAKPKTFDRIIPTKLGSIIVSLCDDEQERDDEEITEVISDSL